MLKRLIATTLILALFSSPVLADSALGPTPDAGNIGPTINTLQPANPSLQSADSMAGGISQPSTSTNLQPAGQSSAVPSLVSGLEADGAPASSTNATSTKSHTSQILLGLIGVLILVSGFFLLRISSQLEETNQAKPIETQPTNDEPDLSSDDLVVTQGLAENVELENETPAAIDQAEPQTAENESQTPKHEKKSRKAKRKKHK